MANILVTGGAGYIGLETVLGLLKKQHKVTIIDLQDDYLKDFNEIQYIKGNAGDINLLSWVFSKNKIDMVIHLAAHISVPESVADPLSYYDNNTSTTINLLKAMTEYSVKNIIFASTAAVYGNSDQLVSELHTLQPSQPYGLSKLFCEQIIQDSAKAYDLNYLIFRYFNVAGSNLDKDWISSVHNKNKNTLIQAIAKVCAGIEKEITVYGNDYPTPDGTCIRDFIHVSDLSDIHCLGVDYLLNSGKSNILNCGYGRGVSVQEALNYACQNYNIKDKIKVASRRDGDIIYSVANCNKICQTLRWSPRYNTISDIIDSTVKSVKV